MKEAKKVRLLRMTTKKKLISGRAGPGLGCGSGPWQEDYLQFKSLKKNNQKSFLSLILRN